MPILYTIGLFAILLTSAIWVGCSFHGQTWYYSQFNMESQPVPESDWRFGVRFREEASSEDALSGMYALSIECVFRDALIIPGQTRSPLPDFPLFEQDLDVDSLSIEGPDGHSRKTQTLDDATSGFILNLSGNLQTHISVNESSSGCFLLTPIPLNTADQDKIDTVIAQAIVQFPACELNNGEAVYAVMGSGEKEKPLTTDDLKTSYDDNLGVNTTLNFGEVNIPRAITRIRMRFVAKIVNHFTSEVTRIVPVDVTLDREDDSYVLD